MIPVNNKPPLTSAPALSIEQKLDEADNQSLITDIRLSHEEVFSKVRRIVNDASIYP